MTVRSFARASRDGIQRGSPPKPARKPSFGPLPAFQTRDEKPFSSTVKVSGSVIHAPLLSPSPPFRAEREGPTPEAWEGEVGMSASALESATSPRPSPPPGAEREFRVYSAAKAAGWKEAGAARSARAIGWGHQRSSHSEKTSLSCGMTFSAKSCVL